MKHFFHVPLLFQHWTIAPLTATLLSLVLVGCGERTQTAQVTQETPSPAPAVERDLTFNDVTLEQSDEQGRLIWKVKSKQARYSRDRKTALVDNPIGQLFQDGKPVYDITSKTGQIEQDGQKLFLRGDIVAKAPKYNLVLRGNELEWQPKQDLLIVRNNLTGDHPQVQTVAREARVRSRTGLIELLGGIQANAKESGVQMRTEHLNWQFRAQKLIADRPVQFDRYQNKKVTDRGQADRGEFDLKANVATLKQNAQISLLEPPIQVNGDSLNWNVSTKTVVADAPVRVVQRQQQITVTADRGRLDMQKQVAYMNGNVKGEGQKSQTLESNQLTWHLPTQQMEATGNVFYRQSEPPASFKGQKAVGKLQDQNLVVSGGRVSSEIVPQSQGVGAQGLAPVQE